MQEEEPQKIGPLTNLFFEQLWGESGDAVEAIKPSSWSKFIPTSLMAPAKLDEYISLSGSPENKDGVKGDAAQLVAEGSVCVPSTSVLDKLTVPLHLSLSAFGFPWIVVQRDDGKIAKFFGSE